jgi:hypothetical protein
VHVWNRHDPTAFQWDFSFFQRVVNHAQAFAGCEGMVDSVAVLRAADHYYDFVNFLQNVHYDG